MIKCKKRVTKLLNGVCIGHLAFLLRLVVLIPLINGLNMKRSLKERIIIAAGVVFLIVFYEKKFVEK